MPWMLMVPIVPVLTATLARTATIRAAGAKRLRDCGRDRSTGWSADIDSPAISFNCLYRGRYLTGALSCVTAFRWLAVALGLVCVTTVLTASMLADKREKILLSIGTAALVANVALNVVLLQRYNFTAAALATAATELLYLVGPWSPIAP